MLNVNVEENLNRVDRRPMTEDQTKTPRYSRFLLMVQAEDTKVLFNLIEKNESFVFYLCRLCELCGEISTVKVGLIGNETY